MDAVAASIVVKNDPSERSTVLVSRRDLHEDPLTGVDLSRLVHQHLGGICLSLMQMVGIVVARFLRVRPLVHFGCLSASAPSCRSELLSRSYGPPGGRGRGPGADSQSSHRGPLSNA